MNYGTFINEHNGYEIYQDGDKFYIVSPKGDLLGTSNCIEGAYVVASLGKQGVKDVFKKKKIRR